MAAASRREPRDVVDLVRLHANHLPLGAIAWAAVAVAPGFLTDWARPPRVFFRWRATQAAAMDGHSVGPAQGRGFHRGTPERARETLASVASLPCSARLAGAGVALTVPLARSGRSSPTKPRGLCGFSRTKGNHHDHQADSARLHREESRPRPEKPSGPGSAPPGRTTAAAVSPSSSTLFPSMAGSC